MRITEYPIDASKEKFHKDAAKALRQVAKALKLPAGSFKLRSNKAGSAVLGEVVLHADTLYIQVGGLNAQACFYRTCKGQKDYTGGANNWLPDGLLFTDTDAAIERFRRLL